MTDRPVMTVRELIKLLIDQPLDRPLYVGAGMGPLADVETHEHVVILLPGETRDGV